MRYIIVDATSTVINAADWDGITIWSPPTGCQAILDDPSTCEMGETYPPVPPVIVAAVSAPIIDIIQPITTGTTP